MRWITLSNESFWVCQINKFTVNGNEYKLKSAKAKIGVYILNPSCFGKLFLFEVFHSLKNRRKMEGALFLF